MAADDDAEALTADRTPDEFTVEPISTGPTFIVVDEYRRPGDDLQHDPRLAIHVGAISLMEPRQVGAARFGLRIHLRSGDSYRVIQTLDEVLALIEGR